MIKRITNRIDPFSGRQWLIGGVAVIVIVSVVFGPGQYADWNKANVTAQAQVGQKIELTNDQGAVAKFYVRSQTTIWFFGSSVGYYGTIILPRPENATFLSAKLESNCITVNFQQRDGSGKTNFYCNMEPKTGGVIQIEDIATE